MAKHYARKKKTLKQRECEICGKKYTPKKEWQKFCGQNCKLEHHRWAVCPKCGHRFKNKGVK